LLRLQLTTQAKCLGLEYLEGVRTIWLQDLFDRFKRVVNSARQRLGLRQEDGEDVDVVPIVAMPAIP
jgi:hypothetical protein